MKSEVIEYKTERELEYPCLKISHSNRVIVLFTGPQMGVVVGNSNGYESLGDYSDTWDEGDFIPFHGVLRLSNSFKDDK